MGSTSGEAVTRDEFGCAGGLKARRIRQIEIIDKIDGLLTKKSEGFGLGDRQRSSSCALLSARWLAEKALSAELSRSLSATLSTVKGLLK